MNSKQPPTLIAKWAKLEAPQPGRWLVNSKFPKSLLEDAKKREETARKKSRKHAEADEQLRVAVAVV